MMNEEEEWFKEKVQRASAPTKMIWVISLVDLLLPPSLPLLLHDHNHISMPFKAMRSHAHHQLHLIHP